MNDGKGTVTLQLPTQLYAELAKLAHEEQIAPDEMVARLVSNASQRVHWRHNLAALREQIALENSVQVVGTKEEVIEQLRETRREIFEAEYAHLYR